MVAARSAFQTFAAGIRDVAVLIRTTSGYPPNKNYPIKPWYDPACCDIYLGDVLTSISCCYEGAMTRQGVRTLTSAPMRLGEPVMKFSFSLLLLLATSVAVGQEQAVPAAYPHPYLYGGLQLNGGGYAPTSGVLGGGLDLELPHLVTNIEASYDNAHKSNDGTVGNVSGHDRYLSGDAFYRLKNRWYFGGGYHWSQLSTTNYSKSASRPAFGGGKDWIHEYGYGYRGGDWSMRIQVLYVTKGSDKLNGTQGPEVSFWMPSPATKHHFFVRITSTTIFFHQTITSTDPVLTAQQTDTRSLANFAEFTFMCRF